VCSLVGIVSLMMRPIMDLQRPTRRLERITMDGDYMYYSWRRLLLLIAIINDNADLLVGELLCGSKIHVAAKGGQRKHSLILETWRPIVAKKKQDATCKWLFSSLGNDKSSSVPCQCIITRRRILERTKARILSTGPNQRQNLVGRVYTTS
jgi:hypothetical protein